MNLKNKKVIITGAGGFIGSHLTEELVKICSSVKALVHYNSRGDWGLLELSDKNIKDNIEIFQGDIIDPFSVENAINGADVVFHLAALISIPYSYNSPNSYVNTNVMGTLNVLEACRKLNIEKLILTSTSETYGTARYVPIDENHPLQGQSPYSASKISADKIAESYYLSFGLPLSIIRPFNTYGPRQSARAIIPTIISQALTGSEIKVGSIEPVRDMNFVKDMVRGFIKIAESEKSTGEVINIGTGIGISIGDLAHKILKILNKDLTLTTDSDRIRPAKSEVMNLVCSNKKAKTLLGWQPKYSIEEGLKDAV